MVKGQKYFTWYESPTGFKQALEATYRGDMIDRLRIAEGRICESMREAKTKAALT